MITVYSNNAEDFTTNGLAVLEPNECKLREKINGEYEVTLKHPIDVRGKWKTLLCGNILRVPVPAAPTVAAKMQSVTMSTVYKLKSAGKLMSKAKSGKVLKRIKKDERVVLVEKTSTTMWQVTAPDRTNGWISAKILELDIDATAESVKYDDAVTMIGDAPRLRDQPFRIYKVEPTLDEITVSARHIFYDLADNMIKKYEPDKKTIGSEVFKEIGNQCMSEHPFNFISNHASLREEKEVSWVGKNPVECILGDSGYTGYYKGEIGRDWFDVYMTSEIGRNSGVQIREGKNLTGITYTVDATDVITRVMPVGETKDGNPLYLSGDTPWFDSPNHFNDYPHPMWKYLEVENAKVGSKDNNDKNITKAIALKNMEAAAKKVFEDGGDIPKVTAKVEFVNMADTEEYRQYSALQNIHLGDRVGVYVKTLGIDISMRMTEYEYNCLSGQYSTMTLGNEQDPITGTAVSGKNITAGTVSSSAFAAGAVDARVLGDDVISTRHLQANSIIAEQIAADSVTAVAIAAHSILSEKIAAGAVTAEKIAAGSVTADKLDADSINAKVAELVNANIGNADIGYAQIKEAKLGTAVADNLIAHDAVTDRYYIDKLQVRSAQMAQATVGELVVKASDGKYYRLDVRADGGIDATEVTVSEDEAAAGVTSDGHGAIIETDLTVGDLAAENLKAVNALIDKLTAARIDADTLFAREAVVGALTTSNIFADGGVLYIRAREAARAELGNTVLGTQERVSNIENYVEITEDGLFLKDDNAISTVKINSQSVSIGTVSGMNAGYSQFAGNYVQFGNYQLRKSADGGLVFKMTEV